MIYYFQGICTRVYNKEWEIDQAIEVYNIYIHANIHTYILTLCMYACMHVCMYMCIQSAYIYINTQIYIYTYIQEINNARRFLSTLNSHMARATSIMLFILLFLLFQW